MQNFNKTLWIALVLITVKYLKIADSFQCFECEDCATIGQDDRDYIKECEALESLVTQGPELIASTKNEGTVITSSQTVQTTMGTTSASNSSLSSLAPPNMTETTQKLQFGSTDAPTTSKTSSIGSTTEKQKVTIGWSIFPKSMEEKELTNSKVESEDRSEELFNWKSHQTDGVCYVLKFNYEGHEVTNRGCGLRGQKKDQICQILSKGEPNSECEVCEGNLCNSGLSLKAGVINLLAVFLVLKVYS